MEYILLINAALALVETLIPKIKDLASRGDVSNEQQEAIKARYEKLRGDLDGAFSGEHWKVRPNNPTPPQP